MLRRKLNFKNTFATLIILLSLLFYFFKLDEIPDGFYHDTGAIALNGLCMAKTGQDEYGKGWPVNFRSFGDYKPPLLIYFSALVFWIAPEFGLNNLRWTSAIAGLLAILICLFTFAKLFEIFRDPLVLAFSFLLLLNSPWLSMVARFPIEASFVPLLVALQIGALSRLSRGPSALASIVFLVSSSAGVYLYHSMKFFSPIAFLFFLVIVFWNWKKNSARWRNLSLELLLPLILFLITLIPFIRSTLFDGESLARFHSLQQGSSWDIFWRLVEHVNGNFFFFNGDTNPRHHHGLFGELNLGLLVFLMFGIFFTAKDLWMRRSILWPSVFLLALLGFIPSSLTAEGVPHALRSNVSLVPLIFLSARGFAEINDSRFFSWKWVLPLALIGALQVVASVYWLNYFYPARSAQSWTSNHILQMQRASKLAPNTYDHSPSTVFERYFRVQEGRIEFCGR